MKLHYALPLFFLASSFELITDYSFVDKKHPVHLQGEFRNVFPAKFRTHSVKGSHVHYEDAYASLYYSHFLPPHNSLTWKVGYSFLEFDWHKNPRFTGQDYHFANASVGWVSNSIKDWRWVLSGAVSVDTHTWDFGHSGVYYGLMWGRYQLSPALGMHIGWTGYVGVENGYLLPILGIDWRIAEQWKLNAVFPLNISLEYLFHPSWSTALEWAAFGRPYRFPMRAQGGIDRYKNGIFEVYSNGLEWDFKYKAGQMFSASFGAGWNFGGWIFIKDKHNHHGKYYKFDDAPYVQGRLSLTF